MTVDQNNNTHQFKNVEKPQFWEKKYLEDEALWDLKGPTPVFQDLAKQLPNGNLCIIGCGYGYDAITFAKTGFNVTVVDFAPSAIKNITKLAHIEKVKLNILEQNIFDLLPKYKNSFDYIIEQTCFCAIHPSRRQEYERLVRGLLKIDGMLLGLWFPLDKSIDEGGPPYGTSTKELKAIFNNGWKIITEKYSDLSVPSRKKREKFITFQKQ